MSEEPDPLTDLTASIVDGESIDWDALRAAAPDEDVRRLLDHLRVVAGVAEVHRSLVDDSDATRAGSSDHAVGASPAKETPRRWGHLLLVRKIGEGAFGEVYEALDTWLDHPRALKLLRPEIAGRVSGPEILHEARKLVRVRHPNVVMVHGADKHDGRVGFWMDLIEGQTLKERVTQGRLSAGEAIHVGQELCGALAAVHQANLLHRDVKAQNVMRASDGGRIILMDFGAGEFRDAPTDRRPQGTPLYLAPEIFEGASATVQSDIYALGVLLYYLVTAGFPVEGKSFPDLAVAHHRKRHRHLRDARPDLPSSFVSVVERAIDPNPERRFQSAGDFYAALSEHVVVRPEPARPAPAPVTPTPTIVDAAGPLQRLGYALLAAVIVLASIELAGFIAYRTFEVAFHVDPGFTAGPADYLRIGREELLPFAIYWVGGAVVIASLAGARLVLGSAVDRFWNPCVRRIEAFPPTRLATLIAVAGGVSWAAITWGHWRLFASMIALQGATPANAPDVAMLGPWFFAMHLSHSQFSAWLSFLLVFAAWRWLPRLEQRSDEAATIRRMKWATITIAVVVVACSAATRRLAWDQFEVVWFDNRPSFVIGTRGDELLLYAADKVDTARQRVRQDSPGLNRPGTTRTLWADDPLLPP